MRMSHRIVLGIAVVASAATISLAVEPTATAPVIVHIGSPTTRPAEPPATQPVTATQPVDHAALLEDRLKQLDPRWRQFYESQRKSVTMRWADAPIVRAYARSELVNISLVGGRLDAQLPNLAAPTAVRVAMDGSNATWTLTGPRRSAVAIMPNVTLVRYDLDGARDEIWLSRISRNDHSVTISAQDQFGGMFH